MFDPMACCYMKTCPRLPESTRTARWRTGGWLLLTGVLFLAPGRAGELAKASGPDGSGFPELSLAGWTVGGSIDRASGEPWPGGGPGSTVELAEGHSWEAERARMVEEVAAAEAIRSSRVLEAMRETPRHEFVEKRWRPWAYYDMALPIGQGQTLTPPSLVAAMTEQLEVQPQHRVLEVGTGCGYQAAILSRLAQTVHSVEIIGSLSRRAKGTLRKLQCTNVHLRIGDGFRGWPEKAPFDRILVTCSPEAVPPPLIAQLADGGRLIIPLGAPYQQKLYRFTKVGGGLVREVLMPTGFVPMTGEAEAGRTERSDPRRASLVNGDFERLDSETGQLAGWYHQRQLTHQRSGEAPGGGAYVTFSNRVSGRRAQAAQAFPIDGHRLRSLRLAGWVQGEKIELGTGKHQSGAVVVAFYDRNRDLIGQELVGEWVGTFDWRPFTGRTAVPKAAREAILLIGLHGATGRLSLAALSLEPEPAQR